jgi:hypothetical protein
VLNRAGAYFIGGFTIQEGISLVCQTKTSNRNETLRSAAQRALEENLVSGLAVEVNILGEYLAEGGVVDRIKLSNWVVGKAIATDRILPDLTETEKLLIGLVFYQPETLKRGYLVPKAAIDAQSLVNFGLCQWMNRPDGVTLELRGVLLKGVIPSWDDPRANVPVAEIDRDILRKVLNTAGVLRYKGADEREVRTRWVIHHISDIHVGRYNSAKAHQSGAGLSMLDEYATHVSALPVARCPSIAIVSGDLTSVNSRDEWTLVRNFLNRLRRLLVPLSPTATIATGDQVVVVPGEHDQNWSNFNDVEGDGIDRVKALEGLGQDADSLFSSFQTTCDDYMTPPFGTPIDGVERPSAVYYKDARILIVPFNSAVPPSSRELGASHFRALSLDSEYTKVVNLKVTLGRRPTSLPIDLATEGETETPVSPRGHVPPAQTKKSAKSRTPTDVERATLLAETERQHQRLLESELSFLVRNDVGVLEAKECKVERIRSRANSAIKGLGVQVGEMLKIAVCHHNVHQQDDPVADLVHAKRFRYSLAKEGFSLLLHGHKHFPYLVHERLPGSEPSQESNSLVTVAAASLGAMRIERESDDGSNERTKAGFNELEIMHDSSEGSAFFKVVVTAWEWDEEKRKFVPGLQGKYTMP